MVVFRSILVPLKAAVLNLLSIAAAYGVIVAIFQWGWGRSLLGIDQLIPIVSFVPMMMFAVLFGLSMDYEVFLLSRIREEYLKTGKNVESVVSGISTTARVITSAALIMIAVFLSFVTQPDPIAKMFGIGLAVAVFIDATVVPDRAGARHDGAPRRQELVAPRLAGPDPAEDEPGVGVGSRGGGAGAGPRRLGRSLTRRSGPTGARPDAGARARRARATALRPAGSSGPPCRPTFSYTITAVSAAIHHRLATPAANISSISAQQQPRQNSPCPRPSRNASPTPRR